MGKRPAARTALTIPTVALLAGLYLAPAAVADETSDSGLWYYYALGLDEIHASGIDGSGVTIAIIDGPINLEVPTLQGTNIDVRPSFCRDEQGNPRPGLSNDDASADHGTEMASLIVGTGAGYSGQEGVRGVAPGARLIYYPHFHAEGLMCFDDEGFNAFDLDLAYALDDAISQGADIVSMSFDGTGGPEFEAAISRALRDGVVLVGALNNNDSADGQLGDTPPSASNGVLSVLAAGSDGNLATNHTGAPNTSISTDVVAPGVGILVQGGFGNGWENQYLRDGTSLATPIVAANIALAIQKFPQATSNQILQSLIHNTGPGDGTGIGATQANWGGDFGYGTVVPAHFLSIDPSQYDDINPFIAEDVIMGPTIEEIFGSPGTTPTPGTTTTPTDGSGTSLLMPLIIGGGIIICLIIAAIVIIAIVTSRKRAPELPQA